MYDRTSALVRSWRHGTISQSTHSSKLALSTLLSTICLRPRRCSSPSAAAESGNAGQEGILSPNAVASAILSASATVRNTLVSVQIEIMRRGEERRFQSPVNTLQRKRTLQDRACRAIRSGYEFQVFRIPQRSAREVR